MQSRYLIIQIDIDEGTQWGEKNTINPTFLLKLLVNMLLKLCKF